MTHSDRHLAWSADTCYWAIADASVLPRGHRRSPEHLGYLVESQLPLAVEDLQIAFTPLDHGRVLACAVERERVEREVSPRARTLRPDGVPESIRAAAGDALPLHRLNLLTGTCRPAAVRRAGRRLGAAAMIGIVVMSGFLTVGLLRRADARDRIGATVDVRIDATLGEALGRSIDAGPGGRASAEFELANRVTELKRTHAAANRDTEAFDAAAMLSAILDAWPAEVTRVRSVVVARDAVVVTADVSDPLVPPRIAAALNAAAARSAPTDAPSDSIERPDALDAPNTAEEAGHLRANCLHGWSARLADSSQSGTGTWTAVWRLSRTEDDR
ncbi:MAG: hypothetical protein AB8G96_09990 [Phycisphaerales bacterium]